MPRWLYKWDIGTTTIATITAPTITRPRLSLARIREGRSGQQGREL
jgi:hypothetical protein